MYYYITHMLISLKIMLLSFAISLKYYPDSIVTAIP